MRQHKGKDFRAVLYHRLKYIIHPDSVVRIVEIKFEEHLPCRYVWQQIAWLHRLTATITPRGVPYHS